MECWRGMVMGVLLAAGAVLPQAGGAANDPGDEPEPPVAAVQALLRREHLYSGPVHGVQDRETVAGIRRYQMMHNLRVTGKLDPLTLRTMLAPPPLAPAWSDADRELLRELAQAPIPTPEPVAERRTPIPPGDPPAMTPTPSGKEKGKKPERLKPGKKRLKNTHAGD